MKCIDVGKSAASDEAHGAGTEMEDPCELCGQRSSKYSCPACCTRTCSLSCVRLHKTKYGCDGAARRTRMVALAQYDALTLLNDYRLLEEAARVAAKNAEMLNKGTKRRELKKVRALVAECVKRRTRLGISPYGMEKSLSNTSVYNPIAETIFWRIEWVFTDAQNYSVQTDRIPEGVKLETLLRQFVKPRPGCEMIIPGFTEAGQFAAYRLPAGSNDIEWRCYMKVERNGWSKETRYHALDVKKTVRENLRGKVVIEFPTIYVSSRDGDDAKFPLLTEKSQQSFTGKKIRENMPEARSLSEQIGLMDSKNGRSRSKQKEKKPAAERVSNGTDASARKDGHVNVSGSEISKPVDTPQQSSSNNDHPEMRPLRRLIPVRNQPYSHRGRYNNRFHPGQQSRNPHAARRDDKRREIDELAQALAMEQEETAEDEHKSIPADRRYPDVCPSECQKIEKPKNDYFSLLGFHYGSSSHSEDSELEEGEIKD